MKRKAPTVFWICISLFLCACSSGESMHFFAPQGAEEQTSATRDAKGKLEKAESISVHVSGEIMRKGVYALPKGSRVEDAIRIAGGFTEDADEDALNLAAFLRDAEKIYVPRKGMALPVATAESAVIDLVTADAKTLMQLPGVGEKTAEKLISFREEHGFTTFEDILKVPGIGKKTLEKWKGKISIGGEIYE